MTAQQSYHPDLTLYSSRDPADADIKRIRSADYRLERNLRMQALHEERRASKRCINGASHANPYAGGRCRDCWEKKLEGDRFAYRRKVIRAQREDYVPVLCFILGSINWIYEGVGDAG